jgi:predicted TIM-barrel fold metal-dependent hydrolase
MSETCRAAPQTMRRPRYKLPGGATDTHFHVFGPADAFPYLPTRSYTPDDALPADAGQLFAEIGIERAVLVQPGVYGTDNRRHLTAAAAIGMPAKTVVAIETDTSDGILADLRSQGACGVRRITVQQQGAAFEADLVRLAERLAEIGWHLQLLVKPEQLVGMKRLFERLPCSVVFDHLGMIDPRGGSSQPAMRAMLDLLRGGRHVTKLSGYYRLSQQGAPYDDVTALVEALVQAVPDRLLWGSDWPHPAFAGPLPNFADLLDPLAGWLPDEALRRQVLVDTPAAFYGFGRSPNQPRQGDA